MSKSPSDSEVRALTGSELWGTCEHPGVTPTHHSCPRCGGTLRRCCDSLVGWYSHKEGCPEVARRAGVEVSPAS